jgi:hypothetical protein
MRIAVLSFILSLTPALSRAQSTPTPESASAAAGDAIRQLMSQTPEQSLKDSLGSYKKMVEERQKRDLMPRPGENDSAQGTGAHFNFSGRSNLSDPLYRQNLHFEADSVDIHVLRLSPRWSAGVGVDERSMSDHGRTMYDKYEKYGFLKFQLGKKDDKKGLFIMPPTSTYTETELGPNKIRTDSEEFNKGLKDLKP